jgi:hypothetical protein
MLIVEGMKTGITELQQRSRSAPVSAYENLHLNITSRPSVTPRPKNLNCSNKPTNRHNIPAESDRDRPWPQADKSLFIRRESQIMQLEGSEIDPRRSRAAS